LRIWQLWNRSQKLFQEFLKSTYVQSLQWLKELRCFENKLIHLKESLIQKWYQLS
jgi:Leucine-rich repeat (LRR) protein